MRLAIAGLISVFSGTGLVARPSLVGRRAVGQRLADARGDAPPLNGVACHLRVAGCVVFAIGAVLPQFASAADACRPCAGYSYPLFNGENLAGWTVENGCEATVEEGAIVLKAGDGWVRSDHTYGDFHLHLEWKALKETDYDAGVYLRALPDGQPFPKTGYQANMLAGKEGNIGKLPGAESTGLVRPAGCWNSFDITVVGEKVTMAINGCHAYTVGGITMPRGHVGFQVEVPKGGQFQIRNVTVTELEHRSLFNGCNLAGWEGAGAPAEECWSVVDGAIQCSGKKGPWLRTAEEYGDFNLRFDYMVSPGGNSGIYVRVPADGNHHRAAENLPEAGFEVQVLDDAASQYAKLKDYQYCGSVYDIAGATQKVGKPAGEWNTMEINCRGQNITTWHNGVKIVEVTPETHPLISLRKTSGYLGLQNHSSVVKFRKLRIGPAE